MITAIKSNPKTSIFGILLIVSEVLRYNPSMLGFLPDKLEGYILGVSSIIFAVLTAIYAKDKDTKSQTLEKAEIKATEREDLKKETIAETVNIIETKAENNIPKAKEIIEE